MVMIGRFSSDDPGWREPSDRDTEPAHDDADWPAAEPRPRRVKRRGSHQHQTQTREPRNDSDSQDS